MAATTPDDTAETGPTTHDAFLGWIDSTEGRELFEAFRDVAHKQSAQDMLEGVWRKYRFVKRED